MTRANSLGIVNAVKLKAQAQFEEDQRVLNSLVDEGKRSDLTSVPYAQRRSAGREKGTSNREERSLEFDAQWRR